MTMELKLLFSEYFCIPESTLEKYGALDICLSADLPLFIDPFLLFASKKIAYQTLHDKIVAHLVNLKNVAVHEREPNLNLFKFPEVKQNWLGWSKYGNDGRGLGEKFAKEVIAQFNGFYSNFGEETISSTSHIEKLTLVGKGIGRDFISDFTTNLILEYLLEYTEEFAKKYLDDSKRRTFAIRCKFNSEYQTWMPRDFILPYFHLEQDGDFIILTPVDILTKDEAFICSTDLHRSFQKITNSLPNAGLRDSINRYFRGKLPPNPKKNQIDRAISETISQFPEILDYYISLKEGQKERAHTVSEEKRSEIISEFIPAVQAFADRILTEKIEFFQTTPNSYSEALLRANYLKAVIENNDGWRIFYNKKRETASEETIQRIFRLTWFMSPFDVNSEVNNGRGPADYKISLGGKDSTIVEFKLASSTALERNLANQTEIYKKAAMAISDVKVILCYSLMEIAKVKKVIRNVVGDIEMPENIIIIDASPKTSASKVK